VDRNVRVAIHNLPFAIRDLRFAICIFIYLISAEAQRNCFCSLSPNGFIVGGEGWGEGETPRAVVTLPRVAAPPPHPTLSPKRGLGERALQLLNFDAESGSKMDPLDQVRC
jgi:hypothetical protein